MSALDLLVVSATGKPKRELSSGLTIDFTGVRIGADLLPITEVDATTFGFGGKKLGNIADPTSATHAATKQYVDSVRVNARVIGNVKAASTANISLPTAGAQSVDGVALVVGEDVLLKNQTDPKENGVYTVNAGTWTRTTQLDNSPLGEIYNSVLVPRVLAGTVNAGKAFVISSIGTGAEGLHTVGTDNITFSEFTPGSTLTAGAGLVQNGLAFDVVAGDDSLTVNANDVVVKKDPAGAIGLTVSGLKVNVDGVTVEIATNAIQVKDAGISAAKLATNSVSTVKIVDGNVTEAKLATDSVSTVKIQNAAVTADKIAATVAGNGLTGGAGAALAVGAGEGVKVGADSVSADYAKDYINDNAGAITQGKVVYTKTNGNVDLANAGLAGLDDAELGVVEDASIASTATGKIVVKRGAIVSGFTGLVIGKKYYVSKTNGSVALYSGISWATNDVVYSVGRAYSATQIIFDPAFEFIY